MPGPVIHHIIVDRLKSNISQFRGLGNKAEYEDLQNLLSNPSNYPYLFIGCQGPDFLFFNTKDIHPTLRKLVEWYLKVSDFIENFKKNLLQAVPQPVLDALKAYDEAKDEVIEDSVLLSQLQQTFKDLNQLLNGLLSVLIEKVKTFISDFNLFDLIDHPYRDGVPADGKWWWFDVLHYRKTGKYAKALLDLTSPSTPEHLYAIGYLTHFSADTVGHPYVNIISGGPYRSYPQRHKTGENFADVFNYSRVYNEDFNTSKLHAYYNFNYKGEISETEPDPFTNLPSSLSKLIADAINKVYQEDEDPQAEYGSHITTTDVNDAYRLYYRWFKNATDTGILPPPVPYSLTADLREVWEKTMDNLGGAGDFLENACEKSGSWGVWGIFIVLAAMVVAAVMAAAALADGIVGAIATLGTSTIRYAACLIYEQIYNSFQNFRLAVAANGLAFPMQEHLAEPRLTQFANPAFPDPSGAIAIHNIKKLPLLRWKVPIFSDPIGAIFNQERHLIYPLKDGEKNTLIEAPQDYFDKYSTYFALGSVPFDENIIDELINLVPSDNTMNNDDGSRLAEILGKRARLGNALNLTEIIYDRWIKGKTFPDFNLDGDRGYAYLSWSQLASSSSVDAPDFPAELSVESDPTSTVQLRFIK
jgi:hypothetical protein